MPATKKQPTPRNERTSPWSPTSGCWAACWAMIREQEGREAFELVERVRKLAVAYRQKHDKEAGRNSTRRSRACRASRRSA